MVPAWACVAAGRKLCVMKAVVYVCVAWALMGVAIGGPPSQPCTKLTFNTSIDATLKLIPCNVGDNMVINGTKFEYLRVIGKTCAYDPSYYCMNTAGTPPGTCPTATPTEPVVAPCPTSTPTQHCTAWKCPGLPCSTIIRYCRHQDDSGCFAGSIDTPPGWPFGPMLVADTNNPLTITPPQPFRRVSFVVLTNWNAPDNSTVTVRLALAPQGLTNLYHIETYPLVQFDHDPANAAYNTTFLSRKVNIDTSPCATSVEVLVFQPNKTHSFGSGPIFILDELEFDSCGACKPLPVAPTTMTATTVPLARDSSTVAATISGSWGEDGA